MSIRNWKYFGQKKDIGLLRITKGQFMTGNILGIIAEKKPIVSEHGNVLNAKSYSFPIRIKFVDSFDGTNYRVVAETIREQLYILEQEGCRAIITSGGNLGLFDQELHNSDLMVLSTPLAVLDFVVMSIAATAKVAVINELSIEENLAVLRTLGFGEAVIQRCVFTGLTEQHFLDMYGMEMGENVKIGAYIWDEKEDYHLYFKLDGVPVYDILKIAQMLKNAVVQMPYEGVI